MLIFELFPPVMYCFRALSVPCLCRDLPGCRLFDFSDHAFRSKRSVLDMMWPYAHRMPGLAYVKLVFADLNR